MPVASAPTMHDIVLYKLNHSFRSLVYVRVMEHDNDIDSNDATLIMPASLVQCQS